MLAGPSDAESYEAVIEVLRGRRVPLDPGASKMLSFLLQDPGELDAEITPRAFTLRFGPGAPMHRYDLQTAPGVVSYLLEGVEFPATRVWTHQLGPAIVPALRDRYPSWRFGVRHVRIEALLARIVIRVRESAARLDEALPDARPEEDAKRFAAAERPCPHCARVPDRYRVLGDGSYVCLLCGRSFRGP